VPELPEAETIARGLSRRVRGQKIAAVEVVHPDVLREPPRRFAEKVRGRTIRSVGRRGKNVLLELDGGDVLAVNLGMTGRLLLARAPRARGGSAQHPAVRFRFRSGDALVFDDVRRFGTVECLSREQWMARSERIGPEPLSREFSAAGLFQALSNSRAPVRSWLLDQRRLAGVGNIYANEALFLARIHPSTPARALARKDAVRLHRALGRVLRRAIRAGGTTLRDYRNADGRKGRYGPQLLVYGRTGEPCFRCGTTIGRVVFGARSAFYCPRCQPLRENTEERV
jgi:formamidopyrimidine-DNA glycosylase